MVDEQEFDPLDWQKPVAACSNVSTCKKSGADNEASDASGAIAPRCQEQGDGNNQENNDTNVSICHQGYRELYYNSSANVLQELQLKCATLEKRCETLEYWLFSSGRVLGPGTSPAHTNAH